MEILVVICLIFFFGVVMGFVAKKLGFPEITGYLVAGILLGPNILTILDFKMVEEMNIFSTIALTFISFSIGCEFKYKYVKRLGIKPLIISLLTSLTTMLLVTIVLLIAKCSFPIAITLGAIASATAPAAIMYVVKEYKAHGELTKNMLSVIAIDDIISIFIFGITIVVAEFGLNAGIQGFLEPIRELVLSLSIGSLLGIFLGITTKIFSNHLNSICLVIVNVLFLILVCHVLEMSPLLMAMINGIAFINFFDNRLTRRILEITDEVSSPIILIFFIISGANLNFSEMGGALAITGLYILARTLGKIIGSKIGAVASKADEKIYKYLGPTLLSQTGLAVGLAIIATETLPNSKIIMTVIIASSFVFDMIGPLILKGILKKAKEI